MLVGRTVRASFVMASIAVPSETPGERLKEIVTEGSCPEWLTVTGPTAVANLATALNGTSAPPELAATTFAPAPPALAAPSLVLVRTQRVPSAGMSCWYSGDT